MSTATYSDSRVLCSNFDDDMKEANAFRLELRGDGKLQIDYKPNNYLENDEGAKGHLFIGGLIDAEDMQTILLDDRLEDSLELQLVKELRRIAAEYEAIAAPIAKLLRFRQGGELKYPANKSFAPRKVR